MVVPHWAYPDSQVLVSYMIWCIIYGCLPFMLEYEIVCWVYDMRTFWLAYPLLVCMIVCGFLLCDDHQPCWCEQMWEPLVVVIIIEMLQFDEILDDYRAHYGGLNFSSLVVVVVSLAWRVFVPRLGLWSLFLLLWICWGTMYVIFCFSALSEYLIYVAFI